MNKYVYIELIYIQSEVEFNEHQYASKLISFLSFARGLEKKLEKKNLYKKEERRRSR